MEKIVFLDSKCFKIIKKPFFEHEWIEYSFTRKEDVTSRLADANIAITSKVLIDKEVIRLCPELKMIAIAGTGTNMIDLDACKERNIKVSNVQNYASISVESYRKDLINGLWQNSTSFSLLSHPINDLNKKNIGIVGEGSIGSSVGKIAELAFNMNVFYLKHNLIEKKLHKEKKFVDYDYFIQNSDIITIHCPLIPQTKNLFNYKSFKNMKNSAFIINTSRGGIINEEDLYNALITKQIAGAALDVIYDEPPKNDNKLLKLLEYDNFILTPHIAWGSEEAVKTLSNNLIDNINNFYKGKLENFL